MKCQTTEYLGIVVTICLHEIEVYLEDSSSKSHAGFAYGII